MLRRLSDRIKEQGLAAITATKEEPVTEETPEKIEATQSNEVKKRRSVQEVIETPVQPKTKQKSMPILNQTFTDKD